MVYTNNNYITHRLHIVIYQVDIKLGYFSALWSFSDLRFFYFSAVRFLFIRPSGFGLMDPPLWNPNLFEFQTSLVFRAPLHMESSKAFKPTDHQKYLKIFSDPIFSANQGKHKGKKLQNRKIAKSENREKNHASVDSP